MFKNITPIPSLLLWQRMVFAAILGLLATRYGWSLLLGFCLLLYACTRDKSVRTGLLLLASFIAFWLYGQISTPEKAFEPDWVAPLEYVEITGKITRVQGMQDMRLRLYLEDVHTSEGQSLPGTVTLTWQNPPLEQKYFGNFGRPIPGQSITVRTKVRPIYGFTEEYWAGKDVWYSTWTIETKNIINITGEGYAWASIRERIRYSLTSFLDLEHTNNIISNEYQASAMIPALIFGDRFYLESVTYDRFSRSNLVHSLALSGQHLSICTFFAAIIAYILGMLYPKMYLKTPLRKVILYLAIPLTLAYVWLGDAPLSLLRAACMLFIGGILFLRARTYTLLDILFTTALLFIVISPQSIFEIGVQLSFLCVFGIALFMPILKLPHQYFTPNPAKASIGKKALTWLFSVLLTSFIIQVVTLPATMHYFGYVSILFPLNLIWLPPLYFIVLPLSFLGLLLLPISTQLCEIIFFIALLPAKLMLYLLEVLANKNMLVVLQITKPLAITLVGYGLAILLFCMSLGRAHIWKKFPLLFLAVVILLPTSAIVRHYNAFSFEGLELTVFDVGQGQGILLETAEGRILIDAGGSLSPRFDPGRDIVAHELTKNKAPHLQYLIASHDDTDHIRGFTWLAETFRVESFIQSTLPNKDTFPREDLDVMLSHKNIPILEIATGDRIDLGDGFYLEVLFPDHLPDGEENPYSSNDGSLVLRLTKNNQGLALFCGDLAKKSIKLLLNKSVDLSADILILPHHGSKNSLNMDFYRAVNPMLAIASSGRFNWYKQPHKDVDDALEELNIPIRNTASEGHIKIKWNEQNGWEQ